MYDTNNMQDSFYISYATRIRDELGISIIDTCHGKKDIVHGYKFWDYTKEDGERIFNILKKHAASIKCIHIDGGMFGQPEQIGVFLKTRIPGFSLVQQRIETPYVYKGQSVFGYSGV